MPAAARSQYSRVAHCIALWVTGKHRPAFHRDALNGDSRCELVCEALSSNRLAHAFISRFPSRSSMRSPYWFLDSRSLSLFRILLGLVALYHFGQLGADASDFFGPNGIVPADFVWNGYSIIPWLFTGLFAAPESMGLVIAIIVLGIAGSLLLLIGWGTRLGAVIAWLAVGTLAARNPLILHAGDSLIGVMLLFAIFLPLDRHFTLRRKTGKATPLLVSNFWSTLWFIQIAVIYLSAAFVKVPVSSWRDGTHLELLLCGTECVTPLGHWLAQQTTLARISTWSSLVIEIALAVLLLALPSTWQRSRLWVVIMAIGLHLMIALTLQVGLFPVLSLAAITLFLPPLFWDRLKFRKNMEAIFRLPEVQDTPKRRWQNVAAIPVGIAIALIAIGNTNARFRYVPQPIGAIFHHLNWKNNWSVFADTPTRSNRLGVEITLKSGRKIDLLEGTTPVRAKFDDLPSESDRFGGSRWRFFLFGNVANREQYRPLAANYLQMLARKHADNPSLKGATWELVLYSAPIPRGSPPRLGRTVIATHP